MESATIPFFQVSEQMKSTGGDREPPEHGLKKYWKEKPKPLELEPQQQQQQHSMKWILQSAVNSAGVAEITVTECPETPKLSEPAVKKMRRQTKTQKTTAGEGKGKGGLQQGGVSIVDENGCQIGGTDIQVSCRL